MLILFGAHETAFYCFPFPKERRLLLFNMADSECPEWSMKFKNKGALIIIFPVQHKGFDIAISLWT